MESETKPNGLRAGAGDQIAAARGALVTTDRVVWLLVVGALLLLMLMRGAFRGALGD
jgi:hypothetical protein